MNRTRAQVLRMLALVPYLQDHDGIPVSRVAEEFGVRPKQIEEDLRLLMFTGVGEFPGELIDFDLTALDDDGIISIRDAEVLSRPLRLTTNEGAALIVALRTLRAAAGESQLPAIDAALAKLETAVSGAPEAGAAVDVHVGEVDSGTLRTLTQGLETGRRLEIEYATASRDEHTTRQVDPRRLFVEQGQHYLEAWCLLAEDLRFFRVDRITSARVTDHWAEQHESAPRSTTDGFFTVGPETPSAVLELSPSAHWIVEYYEAEVLESFERDGEQVLRVRVHGSDESWLRRLVLRNAGAARVVEPAGLAQAVRDAAASGLAAYSG
ncbi:MAG: WYL domain-containing protein [Actinomycetales bacterium]|nr:MAG: WYL domain-containing protein [Actinomycetales bacterium]